MHCSQAAVAALLEESGSEAEDLIRRGTTSQPVFEQSGSLEA